MPADIVNLSFDLLDCGGYGGLRQVADGPWRALQCCRCSWGHKGSVVASHVPFSFFGSRQLRITQNIFFFFFCTWDTWHLAAGSFARQMSVIDILGMRLDFMNCLSKKEMSSMTENGINGGKRRDNQTRSNRHSQCRLDSVLCSGALCFQQVLVFRIQGKRIQGRTFLNPGMSPTGWRRIVEKHWWSDIFNCVLLIWVHFFDQCHYCCDLLALLVLAS